MTLLHNGFTFQYSEPRKIGLMSEGRYYSIVTAPSHGLVMGSIVYFGKKEPKINTVLNKVKVEANFHIKAGNVK